MIYLRHLVAAFFITLAMTSAAYAGRITGSDSIIVFNVGTSPAVDLLTARANGGDITFTSIFWAAGSGGLSGIPSGTPITNTSLSLTKAGVDSFGFTSSDGSYTGAPYITVGSSQYAAEFTGSSGSIAGGSETIGLYLVGTFTPAGSIANLAANTMSIQLTLNENGLSDTSLGSFSASFTVAAPAAIEPVVTGATPSPEPASVLVLASALIALGAIRAKRG